MHWPINTFSQGAVYCVDTDLNESEKVFEEEFGKFYGDKNSEKKAANALAAAEKQVPSC